ncbi:MAG: V-type ATPase subunit [Brevinema sp.]
MESWGYISGLLRAERTHTLTNGFFATLAESPDAESCAKALEDTAYGSFFQNRSIKDFTPAFEEFTIEKIAALKQSSPQHTLFNVYAMKTDLNNLKLLYKAKISQREVAWETLSEAGTIAPERMFAIVQDELYNFLPIPVKNALLELSSKEFAARKVDFLLDKAYYSERLSVLRRASVKNKAYLPIFDLYKKEIDCENIKNILRAKKIDMNREEMVDLLIPGGFVSPDFFIDQANLSAEDTVELILTGPYGPSLAQGLSEWASTKSISSLEKQIDEYLLQQVKAFSYIMTGPAVIEETLRTLDVEMKNLKLIIIGKLNDMSTESIKGRVRNVG